MFLQYSFHVGNSFLLVAGYIWIQYMIIYTLWYTPFSSKHNKQVTMDKQSNIIYANTAVPQYRLGLHFRNPYRFQNWQVDKPADLGTTPL